MKDEVRIRSQVLVTKALDEFIGLVASAVVAGLADTGSSSNSLSKPASQTYAKLPHDKPKTTMPAALNAGALGFPHTEADSFE